MNGKEAKKMESLVKDFFTKVDGDNELQALLENVSKESFLHHPETFHSHAFSESSYTSEDIQKAHEQLAINENHFDSMVNHFVQTLDLHGYSAEEKEKAMNVLSEYREMVAKNNGDN